MSRLAAKIRCNYYPMPLRLIVCKITGDWKPGGELVGVPAREAVSEGAIVIAGAPAAFLLCRAPRGNLGTREREGRRQPSEGKTVSQLRAKWRWNVRDGEKMGSSGVLFALA
jgi:hypothetical protein